MKTFFIKPAPGVKLYDPETHKFINPAGQKVRKTQYWSRRVADGGAIVIEREPATAAAAGGKKSATAPPASAESKKEKKGKNK